MTYEHVYKWPFYSVYKPSRKGCTSALERPPGSRSIATAANSLSSLKPMWPFSFWPKSKNRSSAFWEKWIQNILIQFLRNMLQMELRQIHHWIWNYFLIILDILQLKICLIVQVSQNVLKYANEPNLHIWAAFGPHWVEWRKAIGGSGHRPWPWRSLQGTRGFFSWNNQKTVT